MAVFSASVFSPTVYNTGGIAPVPSGGQQGVPVGWGSGRKHGIAGQRRDDIRIEKRTPNKFDKLRIQEIDNHDIMLFVKTFRQFNQ